MRTSRPRSVALRCVFLASLVMLGLQLYPWSGPFAKGFFNGADTAIYEELGSWALSGKVPYRDIREVYPPLDVLMTAVPHLLPLEYRHAFIVVNFVVFWGLLAAYGLGVRDGSLGVTGASVALLGLPSVLYNVATFNDLWAASTVLCAFLRLRAGHLESGIALLAAGVFFKSYPLFLLPVAFCWAASQRMDARALASPLGRVHGYLAALATPPGLRLVASALLVAALIGGLATLWTGTSWLTTPRGNYGRQNAESLAYLLAAYVPLGWTAGTWTARTLSVVTALGAVLFVPLRRFDDAVRVAVVVVLAVSMAVPFHSPHWNLWFYFLLCLIPISWPLFALLVAYDLDNLLNWPLLSYVTPIEALAPLAREVAVYPIAVQCALKFVLIGWLVRDATQPTPRPPG